MIEVIYKDKKSEIMLRGKIVKELKTKLFISSFETVYQINKNKIIRIAKIDKWIYFPNYEMAF